MVELGVPALGGTPGGSAAGALDRGSLRASAYGHPVDFLGRRWDRPEGVTKAGTEDSLCVAFVLLVSAGGRNPVDRGRAAALSLLAAGIGADPRDRNLSLHRGLDRDR